VIGTVADRALIDRVFGERGIEAVIHGGALHKPDIVRYPARRSSTSTSAARSICSRRRSRRDASGSSSPRPPR
jgi:hypothetical protein